MIFSRLIFLFLAFGFVLASAEAASVDEQHRSVAMRMIGHQVLLTAGDSTTRVFVVENEAKNFVISFENEFAFIPDELIPTISCVMEDAEISDGYIVEVRDNNLQSIIYVYEIGVSGKLDMIPCSLREQPKSDYSFIITFLSPSKEILTSKSSYGLVVSIIGVLMLVFGIGLAWYIKKKTPQTILNPNMVAIGNSQFDKINMNLSIKAQKIDLTHKEAELLLLFHNSANEAIEREVILQKVWGDEGDYVGRTLDVFVSKLRKKIELDSSLKIVNIRGLGYKLVVDI